ncbi:glycosyltransferase [Aerococcaceae bacterium DSM 111022]|nr:glycosyltransferase [Aerococcaceae bacterium DSM 111022]
MAKNSALQISILFISPKKLSEKIAYPLDPSITIYREKELERTKYKYVFSRLMTKFYQNVYQLKNSNLAVKLMHSRVEVQRFEEFFNKNKFDIIIGLAPEIGMLLSFVNSPGKKIGWIHNTYERYFEIERDYLWNLAPIYKKTLSNLDGLVVLTDKAKKRYSEEFNTNVNRIYNPLSFELNAISDLNNSNLIFVGRIAYVTKGLDKLIDILIYLKNSETKFHLYIVGDGPDMSRLKSDIKVNSLDDYVTLVGSTNDVITYYLKSSVFLLPSTMEGFGLVVTEAMEAGLPVVSFETEGPSEIIENNKSGFIIQNFDTKVFAEKVLEILKNNELKRQMGNNAKKRATDFSANSIAHQWINLFKDILK